LALRVANKHYHLHLRELAFLHQGADNLDQSSPTDILLVVADEKEQRTLDYHEQIVPKLLLSFYTPKLSPQPQLALALGLTTFRKEPPNSST